MTGSGASFPKADPMPNASSACAAPQPGARRLKSNVTQAPEYGALQELIDSLFTGAKDQTVRRLDVVVAAESNNLPDELREIVSLLPPGAYTRPRLCDQLNSSLGGHAWGQVFGTVG